MKTRVTMINKLSLPKHQLKNRLPIQTANAWVFQQSTHSRVRPIQQWLLLLPVIQPSQNTHFLMDLIFVHHMIKIYHLHALLRALLTGVQMHGALSLKNVRMRMLLQVHILQDPIKKTSYSTPTQLVVLVIHLLQLKINLNALNKHYQQIVQSSLSSMLSKMLEYWILHIVLKPMQ